jgi:sterol desaturase/sphingolipid hydroxylase (fatty acid hydroxylase superfamily)
MKYDDFEKLSLKGQKEMWELKQEPIIQNIDLGFVSFFLIIMIYLTNITCLLILAYKVWPMSDDYSIQIINFLNILPSICLLFLGFLLIELGKIIYRAYKENKIKKKEAIER